MSTMLTGSVGPFWVVSEKGQIIVLALPVSLKEAVPYGDMLTVEAGHYDYWFQLAHRGATRLRSEGLPTAPVWSEYEEWPRGRVMYDTAASRFVIRADRQLHRPPIVSLIADRFGIEGSEFVVLADDHYRSTRRIDIPSN